jgi:organic hydroperoxide reductase OsmC/OhrA
VAADAGVIVVGYTDHASGTLTLNSEGGGRMTEVRLAPEVEIVGNAPDSMDALHHRASELCFIANSVNFPVTHQPSVRVVGSL